MNVMENNGSNPVDWSVWEVAQVNDPVWAEIPIDRMGGLNLFDDVTVRDRGFSTRGSVSRGGAVIWLARDVKKNGKAGSDSRGRSGPGRGFGRTFSPFLDRTGRRANIRTRAAFRRSTPARIRRSTWSSSCYRRCARSSRENARRLRRGGELKRRKAISRYGRE